mmetsp:Transcript_45953/g.146742  ORF Transcript_45953/g.146742 Transcript_45953/m.146742 type:complete len:414 (+) Transcript_45953:365-1606(+)
MLRLRTTGALAAGSPSHVAVRGARPLLASLLRNPGALRAKRLSAGSRRTPDFGVQPGSRCQLPLPTGSSFVAGGARRIPVPIRAAEGLRRQGQRAPRRPAGLGRPRSRLCAAQGSVGLRRQVRIRSAALRPPPAALQRGHPAAWPPWPRVLPAALPQRVGLGVQVLRQGDRGEHRAAVAPPQPVIAVQDPAVLLQAERWALHAALLHHVPHRRGHGGAVLDVHAHGAAAGALHAHRRAEAAHGHWLAAQQPPELAAAVAPDALRQGRLLLGVPGVVHVPRRLQADAAQGAHRARPVLGRGRAVRCAAGEVAARDPLDGHAHPLVHAAAGELLHQLPALRARRAQGATHRLTALGDVAAVSAEPDQPLHRLLGLVDGNGVSVGVEPDVHGHGHGLARGRRDRQRLLGVGCTRAR